MKNRWCEREVPLFCAIPGLNWIPCVWNIVALRKFAINDGNSKQMLEENIEDERWRRRDVKRAVSLATSWDHRTRNLQFLLVYTRVEGFTLTATFSIVWASTSHCINSYSITWIEHLSWSSSQTRIFVKDQWDLWPMSHASLYLHPGGAPQISCPHFFQNFITI